MVSLCTKKSFSLMLPVAAAFLLSSCNLGPDFHRPPPPLQERYTALPLPKQTMGVSAAGNQGRPQHFAQKRDIPADWWKVFHSRQLNQLIETGLERSQTLAQARDELAEAQQVLRAEIGSRFAPNVQLPFSVQRARISQLPFGSPFPANDFTIYQLVPEVQYILDLFGSQRRAVEAFRARVDYASYELLGAYLTLTGNIVNSYIQIASLQKQIHETEAIIKDQREILKITQRKFRTGGASQQDVLTQQTQLGQSLATLPPLKRQLAASMHEMAVFVGQTPSEFGKQFFDLDKMHLPKDLPVSVPSQLVQQRPDVMASMALLHEANAEIGVTTANLLPQFNLSGSVGWIANQPSQLFNEQTAVWNIAAQAMQQIFNGGALVAERRAAIAACKAANDYYHQTVLEAFRNVSDALRFSQVDAEEFAARFDAEQFAALTYDLTKRRYKTGGQDYLNVLIAERDLQQNRLERIRAQAARLNDTAAIYQALGGGWWNSPMKPTFFDKPQFVLIPAPKDTLHATRQGVLR